MKVSNLIAELSMMDPEAEVVVSKDPEGNSFSLLFDMSKGKYAADNAYYGDFYDEDSTEAPGVSAVCLWPT